jgi:hypothetical protein
MPLEGKAEVWICDTAAVMGQMIPVMPTEVKNLSNFFVPA